MIVKRFIIKSLAVGCFACMGNMLLAQSPWPAVTKETKPWTRWWWMGSAVDEKGLDAQLKSLSSVGFGGVEIVPIYGAKGYESKYIKYLSPQWMKMLDYTVQKAKSKDMGVDMAVGTGWPIGGPQVTLEDAATKLSVQTYSVAAGQILKEKIIIDDVKLRGQPSVFLAALMAYDATGKPTDITTKVAADGTLDWTATGAGNWQLYATFISKTRQAVKRAAFGGEGYTLDHFSKTSIDNYFKTFDTAFGDNSHGVRSFFNDSYEVYGADWTKDFFADFQQRRGYDLKPYIKTFTSKENSDTLARLKSDYRETISELMLENFTKHYTNWAHSKKAINTNQAHGSPGNLLDLYAAVDIPEAETFGSSYFPIPGLRRDSADVRNVDPDPNMLKFASSAAHMSGKKYASSETFTWLTEHFKTSWSQCKPELEQVFLSGINHVFYHGTTYSPADAPWPGWLFYASVNFVPNNSLWPHLKGLNDYITRCQSVLQAGQPDNEIKAYWPVYDAWNNAGGMDMPFKVHDIDVWLHPTDFYKNLVNLQDKGFSIDFVSDKMLQEEGNRSGSLKRYGSYNLLVSKCKFMPVATLRNILRIAQSVGNIVMQDWPQEVPGLKDAEAGKKILKSIKDSLSFIKINDDISVANVGGGRIILASDVQKGLEFAKIRRETFADLGLKFIRRKDGDNTYYYLVNHTPNAIDTTITLQQSTTSVVILDPQTGATGLANSTPDHYKDFTTAVKIQMQPGEALILKTAYHTKQNVPNWTYLQPSASQIVLKNEWIVHFNQGGPTLPADKKIKTIADWTTFSDTATQSFAGTATYSSTFTVAKKSAKDYILKLGKVHESAKVWINGQEVGILWSIPFEARIGKFLKQGTNTIKIEVANLMANRIRDMDKKGIVWRNYHEINFVNINYKDFDASGWKVAASGLEGPVTIMPCK